MDTLDRKTLFRRGLVARTGSRRSPRWNTVTYAIWGPWKKVD